MMPFVYMTKEGPVRGDVDHTPVPIFEPADWSYTSTGTWPNLRIKMVRRIFAAEHLDEMIGYDDGDVHTVTSR